MKNPPEASVRSRDELEAELLAVRRRLAFYETLVEDLPLPIFAKDETSRFCLFNKAYEVFFGARREDMLGRTVLDLDFLSPEERERYQDEDTAHMGEIDERHYRTVFKGAKGIRQALYWSKGIVLADTGEYGRVGVIVDISRESRLKQNLAQKVRDLRRLKAELQDLCRTDALTGLPNRRPFDEMIRQCVAMARRHGHPFCLLMLDLDFFKQVNDRFGHEHGDMVLKAFASILRHSRRQEDLPARLGGEEFALLLPGVNLQQACTVAERIRLTVRQRISLPDGSPQTVSLGLAQYDGRESAENLFRRADEALYRAKHSGRDRFSC